MMCSLFTPDKFRHSQTCRVLHSHTISLRVKWRIRGDSMHSCMVQPRESSGEVSLLLSPIRSRNMNVIRSVMSPTSFLGYRDECISVCQAGWPYRYAPRNPSCTDAPTWAAMVRYDEEYIACISADSRSQSFSSSCSMHMESTHRLCFFWLRLSLSASWFVRGCV